MGNYYSRSFGSPCSKSSEKVSVTQSNNVTNIDDVKLDVGSPDKKSESSMLSIDLDSLNSDGSLLLSDSTNEELFNSNESLQSLSDTEKNQMNIISEIEKMDKIIEEKTETNTVEEETKEEEGKLIEEKTQTNTVEEETKEEEEDKLTEED